ncbi:mRNAion factor HES-1-like [Huso huso]|uniref:mRNAion factor HES-1-like n=1 Tax=Huso huso TaxID=61971 RepID=A0ABR0Y278_HUSHU
MPDYTDTDPRAALDTEKRRSSAGPVITKTSGAGKGNTAGEHRKTSKPMMERRRRARINDSLSQLKTFLIQEAWSKDAPRYSKLEKADILELTVRHLRALERSRAAALPIHDPSLASKYRAGFTQCVREVTQFLSTSDGICSDVRSQLLNHLAGCTPVLNNPGSPGSPPPAPARLQLTTPPNTLPYSDSNTASDGAARAFSAGFRVISLPDGQLTFQVPGGVCSLPGQRVQNLPVSSPAPQHPRTRLLKKPEGAGANPMRSGPQPAEPAWRPW